MPVNPNPITPLPIPPSTSDPVNFDPRADAFLGALPGMVTETNQALGSTYTNATEAAASAINAETSKNAAAASAANAETSKNAAAASAANAETSKNAAEAANTDIQKYYLGRKSTPPVTDNQGNPLQLGSWYTNTNGTWYWWNNSWVPGVGDIAGSYLPLSGGNMTGPITVPANATGSQVPRAGEVLSRNVPVYGASVLMANAPKNQVAFFEGVTVGPGDWPYNTSLNVHGWIVNTWGVTGRLVQTAEYTLNGFVATGTIWQRYQHDSAWSAWRQVITSDRLVDTEKVATVAAGTTTYYADPAEGSVHYITVSGPITLQLPAQGRQLGDQVTIRVYSNGGVRPITLPANSVPPNSGSGALPMPTYSANQIVTLTFFYGRQNTWDCFYGGVHSA